MPTIRQMLPKQLEGLRRHTNAPFRGNNEEADWRGRRQGNDVGPNHATSQMFRTHVLVDLEDGNDIRRTYFPIEPYAVRSIPLSRHVHEVEGKLSFSCVVEL